MTSPQTPARDGVPVTVTGGPTSPLHHRYYVVYSHGTAELAFGSDVVLLPAPITSHTDVAEIRARFQARGAKNVTVLWWTEFPTVPTPASPAGGTP